MNLLETTEMVQNTTKVYVLRLANGALVATQVTGSDDEDNVIFLENPCFMNVTPDKVLLEPMIPISLVKTLNAAVNMNHILMMWEASGTFAAYYGSIINKFVMDIMASRAGIVVDVDKKTPTKKTKVEKPAVVESNVIDFTAFRNAQKAKEEVVSDLPTETDGPELA